MSEPRDPDRPAAPRGGVKPGKDMGRSVRDRLLLLCQPTGLSHQALLTRFVNERLLYRVGASGQRDSLVLKGGMLMWSWRAPDEGRRLLRARRAE